MTTDDGLVGWGESHHGRAPGAVAHVVNATLRQLVLGIDASDVVGVWCLFQSVTWSAIRMASRSRASSLSVWGVGDAPGGRSGTERSAVTVSGRSSTVISVPRATRTRQRPRVRLARGAALVTTLLPYVEAARMLSTEELGTLIDEAHRLGKGVAVHAHALAGIRQDLLPYGLPYGRNVLEAELMVREGMAASDAIEAATSRAARAIGLADEIGSIEAGKRADLIAVPRSPLEHIETLQAVALVMQGGGVVVDRRETVGR